MALFLSTFVNKIDKKGRVSVPASFRMALESQSFKGMVAFRSYKSGAIEGMAMDRMQRLSESVDDLDVFSDAQDDLTATIFADAQMLTFDGEGRVILPPMLLEHAGITDKAAFVGRGATFQIWSPEAFDKHQERARTQVKERTLKLRREDA